MIRQRIRIRFRKTGQLRWISHRDLARAFERLLRRAQVRLSMSEGFHPKPRISFPSALGLGIAAEDECMEMELAEIPNSEALRERLNALAPPGLEILRLERPAPESRKAQVARMTYEISVPHDRQTTVSRSVKDLLGRDSVWLHREGRSEPLDLKHGMTELMLCDGVLRFTLNASRQASVRPREVLQALELSDLEAAGHVLRRTQVQLSDELDASRTTDSATRKAETAT